MLWKSVMPIVLVAVIVLTACGQAAPPTPAPAPPPVAKPAPAAAPTAAAKVAPAAAPTAAAKAAPTAVAKPVEAAKPAAKAPAPAKTEPAPSKLQAASQAEWDNTVAAAKKEGKVVVSGTTGDLWRKAMADFGKAYPEIQLDWRAAPDRDQLPKIVAEQKAGLYLWDLHNGGVPTALELLKKNDAIVPLPPTLMLPEVVDNGKWHQGFDDGWGDLDRKYVYAFTGMLYPTVLVNRSLAPASELKTLDDLLNPKWKGSIAMDEPRRGGPGQSRLSYLLLVKGEDYVRKLLAQDIAPLADARMMLEGLIRGRYAAIIGYRHAEYTEFRAMGLANHIEVLDRDGPGGAGLTHGSGAIAMLKNAPNPNAAKVYLNWFLSKAGQEAITRETERNSRRLDVGGPADTAPKPGIKYVDDAKEQNLGIRTKAIDLAKQLMK